MTRTTTRIPMLTLAREEIRALSRSVFGLGATATILGVLAPIAALALRGPNAFREFLLFTWLVALLGIAIVLAARVAKPRQSRFVDGLFTMPLDQRTWLGAQALVGAFLAALVIAAPLPYVAVHVALVGIPSALPGLAVAALGVAAFVVALGLLCGVVVGDGGPGRAAALAGGLAFAGFLLFLLHGVAVTMPESPARLTLLHVSALSPLSLALDAVGIPLFRASPQEGWRAALGLTALVGGLGAAAWFAYTRVQGPLGWEPRPGRALVAALVAFAVTAPVASAVTVFEDVESEDRSVFLHGEHTRIGFVPRGAPVTDAAFTWSAAYDWRLVLGEDTPMDVLVLVLAPEGSTVRGVRVAVGGTDDVRVVSGGTLDVPGGAPADRARASEGYGSEPSGPVRPVYRVPVTLRAVATEALLASPGIVTIDTTFVLDGRVHVSHARMTLDVDVPNAQGYLLGAGLPLPAAAAGAIVARKLKTR